MFRHVHVHLMRVVDFACIAIMYQPAYLHTYVLGCECYASQRRLYAEHAACVCKKQGGKRSLALDV